MQLDLNLLNALDALLEEGSVTGAAHRLHLSAPAVSRTLGRIRKLTGDNILVRTGRTMTPTPYALAIRQQVSDLVRQANVVLAPSRKLDLSRLSRTFTLQCHDALTTALAPPLLRSTMEQAPGVRLRFMAEAAIDTDELRHGHIDLEIGADTPSARVFRTETIGHDQLVVVRRHTGSLDLATYASLPHILVSRRGRLADPVDELLEGHGLRRRVVASVATSAAALHIVSCSDSVLTAPEATSRPLIEAFNLAVEPLPIPLPNPPIVCNWHQRHDTDQAHIWLRDQVRATLTAVLSTQNDSPRVAQRS